MLPNTVLPKAVLLAVALFMALAGNLFQYKYFNKQIREIEQEHQEEKNLLMETIELQQTAIDFFEKNQRINSEVNIEKEAKNKQRQLQTQKRDKQLERLNEDEQILDWANTPVPDGVIRVLDEATSGQADRGKNTVPTKRTPVDYARAENRIQDERANGAKHQFIAQRIR